MTSAIPARHLPNRSCAVVIENREFRPSGTDSLSIRRVVRFLAGPRSSAIGRRNPRGGSRRVARPSPGAPADRHERIGAIVAGFDDPGKPPSRPDADFAEPPELVR